MLKSSGPKTQPLITIQTLSETYKCGAITGKGGRTVFRYERKNTTDGNITKFNSTGNISLTTQPHVQDAGPMSSVTENKSQNVAEYPNLEKMIQSEMATMTRIVNGEDCPPGQCPWQVETLSQNVLGL